MSTTWTPKNLAFAKLAAAEADIYTAPANTKAQIHNIIVHNTDDSLGQTLSLFILDGSAHDYRIWSGSLVAKNTAVIDFGNEGLLLEAGWKLRGAAGTADKVTISVSGTERV